MSDPVRLAEARRYFTEIPFDALTVVRTGPEKYSFVDASGAEFRPVSFDPLRHPEKIAGFTVGNGNLHFLQRRGAVPPQQEWTT